MYKKLIKTMIFIVFLAFIGFYKTNDVSAWDPTYPFDNDIAICEYKIIERGSWYEDDDSDMASVLYFHIFGSGAFQFQSHHEENVFDSTSILNWNNTVAGFRASRYWESNKKCPKYLIVNAEQMEADEVYFADNEDTRDKIYDITFDDDDEKSKDLGLYICEGEGCLRTFEKKSNSNTSKTNSQTKNYTDPSPEVPQPLDYSNDSYSCGQGFMTGIPARIPKFTKFIYNFLQFMVPIILIILGTIDLVKSITGGKEDEIKKGQQVFIKRLISGFLVFFSFAIVKILVGIVLPKSARVISCVNCFINGGDYCVAETIDVNYTYSTSKVFSLTNTFEGDKGDS